MLKTIFLDLVPYVIDTKVIFNQTWKKILGSHYNEYLEHDDDIQELFKKDLLDQQVFDQLKNLIDDDEKALQLHKDFIKTVVDVENRYFSTFELATPIKNLINDAKNNDCNIVVVSWHTDYLERIKWVLNFDNVSYLVVPEITCVLSTDLWKYTSSKNARVHEFLCLTQVQETIDDLVKKGFFCATISKVDKYSGTNPYVFSSFQNLDFETLRYNFIEVIGDESEDL